MEVKNRLFLQVILTSKNGKFFDLQFQKFFRFKTKQKYYQRLKTTSLNWEGHSTNVLTYLLTYFLTYLLTYLLTYVPACLPACLPTYLPTYLLTYYPV